jgi:hypothetical protein
MSEHDNGWTPLSVWLNTLATLVGSVAGSAALILYLLEKTK